MTRVARAIRRRHADDERGAVTVFVAVVLTFVLVGIAAFTVDLGMQRVARRDMQALADIVALDLAREIDGRSQAALAAEGSTASPGSAASQSLARNGDTFGEDVQLEVDWGSYDGTWNTATNPPSAVRVTARAGVDFTFADGSGDVSRTAYATAASTACYRLGSFTAAVRTGDSTVLGPLNALLGVNLKMAGYQGLAAADVTLGDLAATSFIGTPEELLTGTVSYSNLVKAMIEVLSNEPGSANEVAIDALGAVLKASAAVGSISLGNVMHVAPTDTAALAVGLKVLDILGSAQLANGQRFIDISNLWAGVAGMGGSGVGGSLYLISAAELACGKPNSPEAVADNAQLGGNLTFSLNLNSLNLDLGIGTLQTPLVTGALAVEIGGGSGQLVAPPPVYCGDGTAADPHAFDVAVSTALATYRLTLNVTAEGDLKVGDLVDLGLGDLLDDLLGGLLGGKNKKTNVEVQVELSVGGQASPGSSTAHLRMPPNDVTPVETGTDVVLDLDDIVPRVTSVSIGGTTIDDLGPLSVLTDLVVAELTYLGNDFVEKSVAPLLENLDQDLVGPVARMVGLRFGGADVYAAGAVCGLPALNG